MISVTVIDSPDDLKYHVVFVVKTRDLLGIRRRSSPQILLWKHQILGLKGQEKEKIDDSITFSKPVEEACRNWEKNYLDSFAVSGTVLFVSLN